MNVSLTTATITQVLPTASSQKANSAAHCVFFQNRSGTTIYLQPKSEFTTAPIDSVALTTSDFEMADGTDLLIQSSGGDSTLVSLAWEAYQSSGGTVNLKCGRW